MSTSNQVGSDPGMLSNNLSCPNGVEAQTELFSRLEENSPKEKIIWDDKVKGLGLRIRPNCYSKWIVQWRVQNKSVRRTLGDQDTMNVDEARAASIVIRREFRARPNTEERHETVLMKEFIETFLADCEHRWKPDTFKGYRQLCRGSFKPYFGKRRVADITAADIKTWRDECVGSYIVSLSLLSSLFQHAESLGLRKVGSNPCAGLRRKKSTFIAKYPDSNNYRDIWSALSEIRAEEPTVVDLIRFLIFTGARRGEALNLKWSRVENNRAILVDSKSGPRTIWLAKPTLELLAIQKDRFPNGYVFVYESRRRLNRTISKVWRRIRGNLSLDDMRIHDMRHGFASAGILIGEDLRTIGKALGHRDPNTTLVYVHLPEKAVIDATQRVSTHIGNLLKSSGHAANTRISTRTEYEGEAYSYLERFIYRKLPSKAARVFRT